MRTVSEHGDALEYDLMTRTGRTLAEYERMGAAGVIALVSFVKHAGPDTALWRAVNPDDEMPEWTERRQTNAMLADIYDAVVRLAAITAAHGTGKKAKKTEPYPRPNAKKKQKRIGKGAIAASKFAAWWESISKNKEG